METFEIADISQKELFVLIEDLPGLWERKGDWNEALLQLHYRRYHESDESIFGSIIYTSEYYSISLFVEFNRLTETARFEVVVPLVGTGFGVGLERRLRDFMLSITKEDLEILVAFPRGKFDCPYCKAQYSTRSLEVTKEGYADCPNCGQAIQLVVE